MGCHIAPVYAPRSSRLLIYVRGTVATRRRLFFDCGKAGFSARLRRSDALPPRFALSVERNGRRSGHLGQFAPTERQPGLWQHRKKPSDSAFPPSEPSAISRTPDAPSSSAVVGAIDVGSALRITARGGILAGPGTGALVAMEDVVPVLPRLPVRRTDGDMFPGSSIYPAFPRATAGKNQGVNVVTLDHRERELSVVRRAGDGLPHAANLRAGAMATFDLCQLQWP